MSGVVVVVVVGGDLVGLPPHLEKHEGLKTLIGCIALGRRPEPWLVMVVVGRQRKGIGRWTGLGVWVRSNVTVGNGAEAEIVAMLEEHGRIALARKLGFIRPSADDMEPERSMLAAAEVVEAIAMAAGGRGWLWVPS
ncbi:WRKY DNA-binding protein 31 [Actinidia rufa]|uniref:WRKY DNA-binding protein 31 n=1 Tax=Actinidia rufa TaxID=165716 RepID=A0A7J0FX40_9ERIC|nr:WRKY DNA-binding protein 31 [Actinidia rufa]